MKVNVNNDLILGVGEVSMDSELRGYYQDFKPAIYHFDSGSIASINEDGVPFALKNGVRTYNAVTVCQYGLIQFELLLEGGEQADKNRNHFEACVKWLDDNAEPFKDSLVWTSAPHLHYGLTERWVSSMTSGQVISLYLRAYQLLGDKKYLESAEKAFNFLQYDFSEGGVQRTDENGYMWLEEYPSDPASYVLNGFVYTVLGILDLYRVTKSEKAKEMYDNCITTLKDNIHKYHRWYWSVYDQQKEELVSYYYQKNVHIPLLKILYQLTDAEIFDSYAKKWSRQLNSPLSKIIVPVMYRVQPRLKKLRRAKQ